MENNQISVFQEENQKQEIEDNKLNNSQHSTDILNNTNTIVSEKQNQSQNDQKEKNTDVQEQENMQNSVNQDAQLESLLLQEQLQANMFKEKFIQAYEVIQDLEKDLKKKNDELEYQKMKEKELQYELIEKSESPRQIFASQIDGNKNIKFHSKQNSKQCYFSNPNNITNDYYDSQNFRYSRPTYEAQIQYYEKLQDQTQQEYIQSIQQLKSEVKKFHEKYKSVEFQKQQLEMQNVNLQTKNTEQQMKLKEKEKNIRHLKFFNSPEDDKSLNSNILKNSMDNYNSQTGTSQQQENNFTMGNQQDSSFLSETLIKSNQNNLKIQQLEEKIEFLQQSIQEGNNKYKQENQELTQIIESLEENVQTYYYQNQKLKSQKIMDLFQELGNSNLKAVVSADKQKLNFYVKNDYVMGIDINDIENKEQLNSNLYNDLFGQQQQQLYNSIDDDRSQISQNQIFQVDNQKIQDDFSNISQVSSSQNYRNTTQNQIQYKVNNQNNNTSRPSLQVMHRASTIHIPQLAKNQQEINKNQLFATQLKINKEKNSNSNNINSNSSKSGLKKPNLFHLQIPETNQFQINNFSNQNSERQQLDTFSDISNNMNNQYPLLHSNKSIQQQIQFDYQRHSSQQQTKTNQNLINDNFNFNIPNFQSSNHSRTENTPPKYSEQNQKNTLSSNLLQNVKIFSEANDQNVDQNKDKQLQQQQQFSNNIQNNFSPQVLIQSPVFGQKQQDSEQQNKSPFLKAKDQQQEEKYNEQDINNMKHFQQQIQELQLNLHKQELKTLKQQQMYQQLYEQEQSQSISQNLSQNISNNSQQNSNQQQNQQNKKKRKRNKKKNKIQDQQQEQKLIQEQQQLLKQIQDQQKLLQELQEKEKDRGCKCLIF